MYDNKSLLFTRDIINSIASLIIQVDVAGSLSLDSASTHDVGHINASGTLQHVEGLLDSYGHVAAHGRDTLAVTTVDIDILDG